MRARALGVSMFNVFLLSAFDFTYRCSQKNARQTGYPKASIEQVNASMRRIRGGYSGCNGHTFLIKRARAIDPLILSFPAIPAKAGCSEMPASGCSLTLAKPYSSIML